MVCRKARMAGPSEAPNVVLRRAQVAPREGSVNCPPADADVINWVNAEFPPRELMLMLPLLPMILQLPV
jgi:hypothetical protein